MGGFVMFRRVVLFSIVCGAVIPISAQVNLLTARSYAVGNGPVSLAAADLNGDGKADVVTADNSDSTITVLLNNGDGTFRSARTYTVGTGPVGTGPIAVVVGDFNGDGKVDLAASPCGASGTTLICILLGNGDGTFQSAVNFSTSASPIQLAAADFNGDGKLDLAVTTPNGVDVLLGNGDGSFRTPVTFSMGTFAFYPTVGDFNRDGKLDLAVISGSTPNTYRLSILLGNGNGSFSNGASYPLSTLASTGIAMGDLNLDGKPDLVLSNLVGGSLVGPAVSVMLGNGDGTFSGPVEFGSALGAGTAAVADLNGDGKPDVAVVDSISGVVHVLLGNGDGTLRAASDFLVPAQTPSALAAADFNGDGRPDLATANQSSNTVSILFSNADGTLQAARDYSLGTIVVGTNAVNSIVLGDFNEDGKIDLATGQNNTLGLGNGDGTFTLTNWQGNGGLGITAGDFNHDGHLDVAAVTTVYSRVNDVEMAVYLGNGNGTFQAERDFLTFGAEWVATGDFNGDGNLDLVQTGSGFPGSIALGDGTGNFTYFTGSVTSYQPVVADLNGDGRDDIVYPDGAIVNIALSNANGTSAISTLPYAVTIVNAAVADINGDGKADLVAVDNGAPTGHVITLLGNGDGTFQDPVSYAVGYNPGAVAVADMNHDGRPDLVVAARFEVDILLGNGDGTFQSPVVFPWTGSANGMAIAVGDLNGDGLPDIVVERAVGSSESVTIFLNETGVVPAPANISLASSLNPAASGQAVQLTATVTPLSGSGVPTGTMTFLSGSTSLGSATLSGGSASMSTSTLSVGNVSITASYSGDRFFAGGSSTPVVEVINATPFTLTPTHGSSATVTAGQPASFSLAITPGTAESQTVSLTCGTPPPSASCTISPSSVVLSGSTAGSATVTIQTSASASAFMLIPAPGAYTATSLGWLSSWATLWVVLIGGTLSKRRRRDLALIVVPACLILLGSCGGNGGSAGHGTPAGTYTIAVTAQAGGSTQAINLSLTVQ